MMLPRALTPPWAIQTAPLRGPRKYFLLNKPPDFDVCTTVVYSSAMWCSFRPQLFMLCSRDGGEAHFFSTPSTPPCTCSFVPVPSLDDGRVGALATEHLLLASARAVDPRHRYPEGLAEIPPGLSTQELAQLMKDDPACWEGLLRYSTVRGGRTERDKHNHQHW